MSGRWWRAYTRARHDPKMLRLSDKDFRWWFNLICVAGDNDGRLPFVRDLAAEFRVSEQTVGVVIERLRLAGLFEIEGEPGPDVVYVPHNWNGLQYKSDVSNERVKRFRERQRNAGCNVTVAPSESDTETDKNSVAKATGGKPPDVATIIFGNGLAWLKSNSGKSEPDCRALLGRWRRELGDEGLMTALGRAQREGALQPVSWMEAAIKAKKRDEEPKTAGWN